MIFQCAKMTRSEEEATPLLTTENPQTEEKRLSRFIIGAALGLLSSLTFACNNYAIKTWKIDFVDVLLVRSSFQIVVFGILAKSFNQNLLPRRDENDNSCIISSFWRQTFLLLFQVSSRKVRFLFCSV